MGLYKQKSGKYWWISFSYRGRQIRKSTGTTKKKVAEAILAKTKTKIVENKFLDISNESNHTFEEMVKRYLEDYTIKKKPSTQRDDRRHFKNWNRFIGHRYLDEVTSDLISQYVKKRKDEVGPSSINRELAFLSATFNKAIRIWGWCRHNPVSGIPREKEKKRVKYFSDEEFSEIYKNLADWVKPIVLLGKNTGLRLSNLVKLRWDQVNLRERIICLDSEEMKNSQSLGIPLNKNSYEILKNMHKKRKVHSVFVFVKINGNHYSGWGVYHAFKKACKEVGFPDFRFHDLRHDFCSKLVQAGVDLYTVKELAGHKDITTTQRYAHLSPDHLREAVSVLNYHKPIIEEKNKRNKAV